MKDKIFRASFFTSMFVLVISIFMIFSVLGSYFETQMFSELESETQYISYGIKDGEAEFLKSFEKENKRITIISPDGTVLADTKADTESLENHSERKEVKETIANGSGKSKRYSDTLLEKTLYCAKKLDNGNILRVSTTQKSVLLILLGILQPIILIVFAALCISLFLSYKVSNSVIKPINAIDLEKPETADAYEEFEPFLKKISAQNKTIKEQIKEAEKSREEFRLICENMNEGFLVTDKNAKVLSYNSAALRLLDIDKNATGSVLVFNRTKNFREVTQKALSGERAETTVCLAEKTYSIIANPVYRSNKTIGTVIVIIDITESAEREKLRREFTSNVSHELKTPLTSISGFAEMLKTGGTPNETVVDFSSSIYDEAQRLINLVSDIMKISELDEGGGVLDTEKVDLYLLAKEVSEKLKPVAEKQNITLSVIGGSAYVKGVKKILCEMIYNLCDNAIKYNKTGGTVDIIVTSSENGVKLTVRDTGMGIPKNEQSRVFERFYRVDKSRSKSAGGTGLGLAIVKHGAMYHNAAVTLESTEGKGTSITLEFFSKYN